MLPDCYSPQGFVHMLPLFCFCVCTTRWRRKSRISTALWILGVNLRANSGSSLSIFLSSLLRVVASITSPVPYMCWLVNRACCDPQNKSQMPIRLFELRDTLLCLLGQPFCFRCLVLRLLFGFFFWNNWYSKHISRYWTSVNPCCSL